MSTFMAPSLTSNSFLLSTTPQSRLSLKNPRLAVFAKGSVPFSSFQLGKAKHNPEDGQAKDSGNSSPFQFNFGNLPDVKTLIPIVTNPSTGLSFGNVRRKDPNTVFVAGATGQAGIRIAQTLLRQGFSIISNEESKRLNAVESILEDAESITKAIGNASKVVVTIGPGENGPTSAVSATDAVQVIQAAKLAGVGHVAIVYDGNAGNASTYNTTLTEDYSAESSYNVVVSAEGSVDANDYKVAKSQIASLVADVFSNTAVAENKLHTFNLFFLLLLKTFVTRVVEVSTSPSAPLKGVNELFSGIPEDGRRKAYSETMAKAKAEEEAILAAEKAREAADASKKLEEEEEVKKLSEQEARAATLAEEAQEKAQAAGASVEGLLSKAKDFSTGLSWEKFSSQLATAVQKSPNGEQPKVQIATVRGQAKARNLPSQKANVKQAPGSFFPKAKETAPKPKPKAPKPTVKDAEKTDVRKVFGGLFQQETIYVEDD
ncbi:tropinone reductase-like protein [Hibiscus syriacus]|uniref:Tropinone reductase-like protein n=1 Tax=Hibiscus syriacus TaxID=106335 RepID=A0A6A3B391_HIBSY|nr:tropinone reductase-like protein [Hibiscus syriacus]